MARRTSPSHGPAPHVPPTFHNFSSGKPICHLLTWEGDVTMPDHSVSFSSLTWGQTACFLLPWLARWETGCVWALPNSPSCSSTASVSIWVHTKPLFWPLDEVIAIDFGNKDGWEVLSGHLVGPWPCFLITVALISPVWADALLNILFKRKHFAVTHWTFRMHCWECRLYWRSAHQCVASSLYISID